MAFAATVVVTRPMPRASSRILSQQRRRTYGLLLFMAVLLLGVCYLWQTNAVATKGYEIKALSRQLTTLRQDNQRLEVQSAELQAAEAAQPSAGQADLVAVEHIEYLASEPGSSVGVAVR